jgi:hypothetical protein
MVIIPLRFMVWAIEPVLIYFLQLGPSRETANCAATQELPNVRWNPNVHYRVHKGACGRVVKTLCYKPESRGFDSR